MVGRALRPSPSAPPSNRRLSGKRAARAPSEPPAPPLAGDLLDRTDLLVERACLLPATVGRVVDELDVVVAGRSVEPPVARVREHHLLVDAVQLADEEDLLVRHAYDRLLARLEVGVDRQPHVEARLLDRDQGLEVGHRRHRLRGEDDPELRGVVERDADVDLLGDPGHPVDDLVLGLRHHVRRREDDEVEPELCCALPAMTTTSLRHVWVTWNAVRARPRHRGERSFHQVVAFGLGEAPELSHVPGEPEPAVPSLTT